MARTKRTPTADVRLSRPDAPITRPQLLAALAPLLELVRAEPDDLHSITVTHGTVRLQLIPRARGRRQLDSMLRVSYPIVFDPED